MKRIMIVLSIALGASIGCGGGGGGGGDPEIPVPTPVSKLRHRLFYMGNTSASGETTDTIWSHDLTSGNSDWQQNVNQLSAESGNPYPLTVGNRLFLVTVARVSSNEQVTIEELDARTGSLASSSKVIVPSSRFVIVAGYVYYLVHSSTSEKIYRMNLDATSTAIEVHTWTPGDGEQLRDFLAVGNQMYLVTATIRDDKSISRLSFYGMTKSRWTNILVTVAVGSITYSETLRQPFKIFAGDDALYLCDLVDYPDDNFDFIEVKRLTLTSFTGSIVLPPVLTSQIIGDRIYINRSELGEFAGVSIDSHKGTLAVVLIRGERGSLGGWKPATLKIAECMLLDLNSSSGVWNTIRVNKLLDPKLELRIPAVQFMFVEE